MLLRTAVVHLYHHLKKRLVMKHLFTILFIFSITVFCSAQDMASLDIVDRNISYTVKPAKTSSSFATLRKRQTVQAMQQLKSYADSALTYAEVLRSQNVAGTVNIEITVAKDGKIVSKSISSNSNLLRKLVERSIQDLKSVEYDGPNYLGVRKLTIPVTFSIEN